MRGAASAINTLIESESILERTLATATPDKQTVTAEGRPVSRLLADVSVKDLPTHVDRRGSVFELFDMRWGWHADPMVSAHCCTIRPGFAKGWALHKRHDDRYVVIDGEMVLVLYDARPDSPSEGEICEIFLSGARRQLVNIPRLVWHAEQNVGTTDVVIVNFPTEPYDYRRPDKYRLPIDTDLIPYSFPEPKGW